MASEEDVMTLRVKRAGQRQEPIAEGGEKKSPSRSLQAASRGGRSPFIPHRRKESLRVPRGIGERQPLRAVGGGGREAGGSGPGRRVPVLRGEVAGVQLPAQAEGGARAAARGVREAAELHVRPVSQADDAAVREVSGAQGVRRRGGGGALGPAGGRPAGAGGGGGAAAGGERADAQEVAAGVAGPVCGQRVVEGPGGPLHATGGGQAAAGLAAGALHRRPAGATEGAAALACAHDHDLEQGGFGQAG